MFLSRCSRRFVKKTLDKEAYMGYTQIVTKGDKMTTYEQEMNLILTEQGSLAHTYDQNGEIVWHPTLEVPATPEGVHKDIWNMLHQGFVWTSGTYNYTINGETKTVFQMTEAERLQWCAETLAEWQADEDEQPRKSDRERDAEHLYYSGFGDRVGLDPFAYDSQGNDTGLRMSDFI